jgi:hypothetical protein
MTPAVLNTGSEGRWIDSLTVGNDHDDPTNLPPGRGILECHDEIAPVPSSHTRAVRYSGRSGVDLVATSTDDRCPRYHDDSGNNEHGSH